MKQHEAYLKQARSDFQVFRLLLKQDRTEVPECHVLHYLQMATEKLAKAAFLSINPAFHPHTHVAFSHIPHHLRRADVAKTLGWKTFDSYRVFLKYASPLFRQIDELNPAVGPQLAAGKKTARSNVEYPWETRNAAGNLTWRAPTDHQFGILDRLQKSGSGVQLWLFVNRLIERFESIF
ncbi:MAG: hypothetical protein NTU53_15440 [Planctomycetota bacterium]|nr:hypothetical protein [Planctomycetota bacterium]